MYTDVFIKQDPMRRVLYALIPIFIYSIFLYGWRSVALTGFVFLIGITVEFIFEKSKNKKVTEAVMVSSALFALSLPPGAPFWVAGVGIVFAVLFGKEVYGGFGRNIYNPAITGRTFVYISFPLLMQTTWMLPGNFGIGSGLNKLVSGNNFVEAIFMLLIALFIFVWYKKNAGKTKNLIVGTAIAVAVVIAFYVIFAYSFPIQNGRSPIGDVDVVAMATPIEISKGLATEHHWSQTINLFGSSSLAVQLEKNDPLAMFFGIRVGSLGEGPIFLLIIAAIYLLFTKTANWRPMLWTVLSALLFTCLFYFSGMMSSRFPQFAAHLASGNIGDQINDILVFMMSGALIYGAVFMSTDPVSAPKKPIAQHIYGFLIGSVTIVIRVFAGFPEGISFAILTANTFASLIDEALPTPKKKTKPVAAPAAEKGGAS